MCQAHAMVIEGLRAAQDLRPIIPSISTAADSKEYTQITRKWRAVEKARG
jgi:hypothetical protein